MANTPNLDLENVNVLLDTDYAYNQLVSEIITKINSNNLKIDGLPNNFIPSSQKGAVNGVATLGNDGIIPKHQLPTDSGSVERVADIVSRDAITNLYDNKLVFVIDATDDTTVGSGWAMYIYSTASLSWTKIVDGESLDLSLTWDEILNKPEVFPPETHDHAQIDINAQNITDLQNTKVDKIEGSRLVSETEIAVLNDKYSKTEVDNKLSMLETNIDWKESVSTFADIAITYPVPEDGWTVNTRDTDYTYRYNGTSWVAISANAIPKATTSVDGLMSKEDKLQVDTNKTDILSAKTTLGSVAMTTTAQTVTGAINELDADIGNKSTLTTTDKTNLVNAVNETKAQINSLDADIITHKADIVKLSPLGVGIDDTPQIQTAIDSLVKGGRVELTGDFNIQNLNGIDLKSDVKLIGRGKARLLGDGYLLSINRGTGGTNNVADNIKNILIEGITLEHITKTFSEHTHLININACSNVEINKCEFIGFRGDGIYIGSSNVAGVERHNENIYIHNNIFDGVAKANRNAITIIDGVEVKIQHNIFKNCTTPTMPGAIDIEPNGDAFAIVKDIFIFKNKFKNIGGNIGAISAHLPISQEELTTPINNIIIEENSIENSVHGINVSQVTGSLLDTTPAINLKVAKNNLNNITGTTIGINGIRGFFIEGNVVENCQSHSILGSTDKLIKDCQFINNAYRKCGLVSGFGLIIYNAHRLDIKNNTFDDCGSGMAGASNAIDFISGTSSYIRVIGNTFISPTGKTLIAIQKESAHIFTPSTNTEQNNNYNGLANFFVANLKDSAYNSITYDATMLPDSFSLGVSTSIVNSATGLPPGGFSQGILVTHKLNDTVPYRSFTTQWFYPANNGGVTLTNNYYRKANPSINSWSEWYKLTGVLDI